MGPFFQSSNFANLGLNFLCTAVKSLCLLASTPANLAACTANANQLAFIKSSVTSAAFTLSSDTTIGGYKVQIASFATIAVNVTGNATCLVLYNTAGGMGATGIHYYTKCSVNLASTLNSVTIQPWSITIADPTS